MKIRKNRNHSKTKNLSFPNALVGNPNKVVTGPPTKTFGGDSFGISSNKLSNPNHSDWNRFWNDDSTQKFTQVSWSKRRILRVLKPYVVSQQRALDAGCGSGFFSKYFCDEGMSTVSLDYSSGALEIASRASAGRAKIVQKDLLTDDIAKDLDGRFDLIFSDGLLEHFSSHDQDRILQNLKAILNPQGVLITFVPNRFSPWELIRPWFMPGIEETPFVLKELIDLNQRNGFKVMAKGGVNTFPLVFSPDRFLGAAFGMLLYTIAKKDAG